MTRRRERQALLISPFLSILALVAGCHAPEPAPEGAVQTTAAQTATASPQVCTGEAHTCVRTAAGKVLCTGRNLDGELGDGTAMDRFGFVPVVGLDDASEVACGYHHTCAIRRGGEVVCWGRNHHGELGDGTSDAKQRPVAVHGLTDARALAAGDGFTCATIESGEVRCWGEGANGRLGHGAYRGSALPVTVSELDDVEAIALGRAHACAQRKDGKVACWGAGGNLQLGRGDSALDSASPRTVEGLEGVEAIGAGGDQSCAASTSGVACWGNGRWGALGDGASGSGRRSGHPVAVTGVSTAEALVLGPTRSCARMPSGGVLCWGHNNFAAELLGVGSTEEVVATPSPVLGLEQVADLAVSRAHACALTRGGELACWGSADTGRFGARRDASTTAVSIAADVSALAVEAPTVARFEPEAGARLTPSTTFAVGDRHVCGLAGEASGRVLCFGDGQSGQLGTGSTESTRTVAPRPVVGLTDAVQVAAGIDRACALRANGEVACWGSLTGGRSSSLPVPIDGIDDAVAIAVGGSARGMRLCALRAGGHVTCVGDEAEGAPVDVPGIGDAAQIAVGLDAACARRRGGTVSCWGAASEGQLGHGSTQASASPVEVVGLAGVTGLAAGERAFCAIEARGRVACWGDNEHGQIGDGKRGGDADARAPIVVRGVSGVASVGLGGGTACAVGEDGSARCWGENAFSQTGRPGEGGGDVLRPSEVRPRDAAVAGFGPYAAMDCGTNVCCGLHRDGHVSCQGSGSFFGSTEIRIAEPRAISGITYLAPRGAGGAGARDE